MKESENSRIDASKNFGPKNSYSRVSLDWTIIFFITFFLRYIMFMSLRSWYVLHLTNPIGKQIRVSKNITYIFT